MLNHRPFSHLDKLVREKKIRVRYPKGYKHWKARFDSTMRETKGDVQKTLEKIHGKKVDKPSNSGYTGSRSDRETTKN